jgi:hypothetical protein
MQIESANHPRWANAAHTAIDLNVKLDGMADELPFTASATDTEEHGREIYAAAAAGAFGAVAAYVAPPPPPPLTAEQIEALRKAAYREESDPLFFKWQRGEATEADWLAKIAEIKARYPEPQA